VTQERCRRGIEPRAGGRDSPIHGRGLFAVEPISKGDIVAVKGGYIRLTSREVERTIADGAMVDAKSIAAYARAKMQGVLAGLSA
jgi:hypothetical protein